MNDGALKIESTEHGPEARVTWMPFAVAFALAAMISLAALVTCGASLALFLSGFFFLTILLPPLILTQDSLKRRVYLAACVVDGIALIWLIAVFSPEISLLQWVRCCLVLIAYAAMLGGVATALVRIRIAPLGASAITILLSMIWLTLPIWLSANLTDNVASRLICVHPLFAINGVLAHLGTWSHWPIAYRQLTTLGQDVAYTLPTSIWPAVLFHALSGCLSLRARK